MKFYFNQVGTCPSISSSNSSSLYLDSASILLRQYNKILNTSVFSDKEMSLTPKNNKSLSYLFQVIRNVNSKLIASPSLYLVFTCLWQQLSWSICWLRWCLTLIRGFRCILILLNSCRKYLLVDSIRHGVEIWESKAHNVRFMNIFYHFSGWFSF